MSTGKVMTKRWAPFPVLVLVIAVTVVQILSGPETCFADDFVLQWAPVSDPTVTGYKVYYQAESIAQPFRGTGSTIGDSPVDAGNQTTYTITGLDPAHIWYFAVTAYTSSGLESAYSNIVCSAGGNARVNVALQANGGVATASSTYSSGYPVQAVNNGDHTGANWGAGGGWLDATPNTFPDWVQVTFNGQKTINEIDVFTVQDNYTNPVEPTATLTFTKYGITAFDVQYWNGSNWVTVPGGSITGNNLVWRKVTFAAVTTDRIRIVVNGSGDSWSHITEIEAYTAASGNAAPSVTLTAPANGAVIPGPATVTLTATASDGDGTLRKVEFYSGGTLLGSAVTPPYSYTWPNVPLGPYNLMARAYDNLGATADSAPTAISVVDVVPPTVSIVSPAAGARVTGTVAITITSSDNVGVALVDFAANGSSIGFSAATPFTFLWDTSALAFGTYSLTASARDSSGNVGQSAPVSVIVAGDTVPPVVSFTAPVAGAALSGIVTISASASDNIAVNMVEFYIGGTLLSAGNATPYTFNWDTTTVANGSYTLTAKAYDPAGNVGQSSVTVTVSNAVSQRVNVALQANGGVATASSSLSDTNGTYPVQAVNDGDHKGLNWGTSGGWADATANVFPDWVQINFGGQKTINEIDVYTVQDNYANPVEPTATLTFTKYGITAFDVQYWNGSSWVTVSGGSITGNNLVWRKVTFAAVTTDRIRVVVNAALGGNSRIVEIEAYTMAGGNTPPTVTLSAPANGASYAAPASINLTASASDSDGTVTKVEFYNGSALLGSATAAPYSFTWSSVAVGTYTLKARAYDNLGATTDSTGVVVTVTANTAPSVALTTPVNGAIYASPATIAFGATASDSDGTISKVEFYNGSTLLGSDTTAPYSFTWSGVAAGTYTLTAKAYDNLGATANSTAVTVTVRDTTAPTISITSPANNATVSGVMTLSATATDNVGVTKVEFYVNGYLDNTLTAPPYSYSGDTATIANGSCTFTAKAYDAAGNVGQSSVTVTISNAVSQRVNVALQANGGVATASSSLSGVYGTYPVQAVNDGDHKGLNWGTSGGWADATANVFPDWVQINFGGQKTINEIDVYTVQDNYANPVEPTATLTFTKYGITAFDVQYWNGSSWVTVSGGSITGNNLVWRKVTFAAVTTDRIRVVVNAALGGNSRIVEIEAYTP